MYAIRSYYGGLDVGIYFGNVHGHGIGEGVEGAAGGSTADFDAVIGGCGRGNSQSNVERLAGPCGYFGKKLWPNSR